MIAALIRIVTGTQARWQGVDPEPRQRIYFGNHRSNLDAPVIWAALPPLLRRRTRPVAAHDYWTRTALRRYLATHVFRVVLIHRTKLTAENHPLVPMETALDAGDSLILFPEGTRAAADADELNPFKPGLWHLATRHPQVELIPVLLENLNRILPKGEVLLVPVAAIVRFGAPLGFDPAEPKEQFLARARAAVAALADSP